jgi:hypothetical protein
MSRMRASSRKLWIGAGALFVGAFVMKQYIFYRVSNQVKELRDVSNYDARKALDEVYENSQRFSQKNALKPLSLEDREKAKRLKLFDEGIKAEQDE